MRLIAGILIGLWILLILLGKGGFVHLLFFVGFALLVIEIICIYRVKITK